VARTAPAGADHETLRLPAFRFLPSSFRHCERSEAIQCGGSVLDCFVASAPRNDDRECLGLPNSGADRVARTEDIALRKAATKTMTPERYAARFNAEKVRLQ
jgi:hypothetical protein